MNPTKIRIIERLRAAAKDHGEVFDLLQALSNGIQIDGAGNKDVIAVGADLEYLQAALLAASFAEYDATGGL